MGFELVRTIEAEDKEFIDAIFRKWNAETKLKQANIIETIYDNDFTAYKNLIHGWGVDKYNSDMWKWLKDQDIKI